MAENNTKPTRASVADYIASRAKDQQRPDCRADDDVHGRHAQVSAHVADVDTKVLRQLVADSMADAKRRYGQRHA